VFLENFKYTQM